MKTLIRSINRSPLRCGFFTVAIALAWFALSPPLNAQDCPSTCPGGGNTGVGAGALDSVNPLIGFNNTAMGLNALTDNTTGGFNAAIGAFALARNTTGQQNMAIGQEALANNVVGNFNMAIGFRALFMNRGFRNSAIGAAALRNNTTGVDNTAIGSEALRENTTTGLNVAVGDGALTNYNGGGTDGANTALGSIALTALTSGIENTVVGRRALQSLTSGGRNVAVGWRAGNILTTGSNNTFIGTLAGSTEGPNVDNVICIDESGDTNGGEQVDNRCYIGNIRGADLGDNNGLFVLIDGDGQLGTINSSRRFKQDIKPMGQTSEAILALKPVTFHYKSGDTKKAQKTPQFGLVAEDVEQVNRDLVVYGKDGQVLSVRYEAVNAMLLNEFLKEHKKVEEQQTSIADLKSTVALQRKEMQVLTAQLKEQAAQIQKVSAQLEASKPAPKVVANK
jgi:trimeric autotransporter adhesin